MGDEGEEETQIDLYDAEYIDKQYVRYSEYDFIYYMFKKIFEERPPVTISKEEHKIYQRIDRKEALKLNLIQDLDECIRMVYPETR